MFKRIVVGISGGVDSAVTAFLLKKKGYDVVGVFMRNWDITNEVGKCVSAEDYEDAQKVCAKLDIPFEELNFVKEYWVEIFADLLEKYQMGYTPNPDILCNKNIKFDQFFSIAQDRWKADAIATGHYANTSFGPYLEHFKQNTYVQLLKAQDQNKDQTFFLCQVPQKTLRYTMFPLGEYTKDQVKRIAMKAGFEKVAKKKESMGICFVGKRNFPHFIAEYIEDKPGNFINIENGETVGKHDGIHQWTVGQRCKIGGLSCSYFVCQKDLTTNNIFVVNSTTHPALFTDFVVTHNTHWISEEPKALKNGALKCDFRFQHRKRLTQCNVFKLPGNKLFIYLSKPLRALTKGQYAVLYDEEECLGGSEICSVGTSYFFRRKHLWI